MSSIASRVLDARGRPLHDLRISVTDRCNFRCTYCMPREVFNANYSYVPRREILSFEETARIARLMLPLGVQKIRITGGEPLMRRDLDLLIHMLAEFPQVDLALTTNGVFLPRYARRLKQAGLRRITVSLDALNEKIFQSMSDSVFHVEDVLNGMDAAVEAGFDSLKINMVVRRGINEQEILPMVERFRHTPHTLRFIEFMDTGNSNGWQLPGVFSAGEILSLIQAHYALEAITSNYPGEVAQRWRFKDGAGEIGIIASVTQAFCSECTRLRLSVDGKLYTCLFAVEGFDLRTLLRSGISDEELQELVKALWARRQDRYSEIRLSRKSSLAKKIEMSYIGG